MLQLERVERLHLSLLALVVASAALTNWLHPWSVAAGGGVMAANVWLMKSVVRRALRPDGQAGVAMAMLAGKFGLLLALLVLLFWRVSLDGMSFAVGITLFPAAAVIEAVRVETRAQGEQ